MSKQLILIIDLDTIIALNNNFPPYYDGPYPYKLWYQ